MTEWVASGTQSFDRVFTYDSLNRLATLNQNSGNATNCSSTFGLSWNYDAWGNRTDQNVASGTCNAFHASVNGNDQLSGSPYQYDAAGNMTNDGNHAYFYDAENRLIQVDGTLGTCSTATACYSYDALGHRTVKQTGSYNLSYFHDLSGNAIGEYCGPCSWGTGWNRGYVYMNGQQVAEYSNGTTYFVHPDHLGSARLRTALNQSVFDSTDFLPFGEILASNYNATHYFTGDEHDYETDLDHTQFRQYSSQLGRWMTPDPAGLAAVDPTNPQSWNRYAYVINNPLTYVDPSGMDFCSGNSPYTTGGGGTNNLPTPNCVPTGIPNYYDASYNGPAPDWQNQNWQAVDTWFNNQGITEYAPLPTGLLNYNANQGDLGMLGSQERAVGFKYVVTQIIADWTKYGLNPNSTLWLQYDLADNVAGTAAALNAVNTDLNVLNGLSVWESMPVPTVPPAPCVMNAGLAMGVWKGQLLAWLKSHPGQAPPPAIATPPSLSGVCG